jgi:hypothetical protein
MNCSSARGPMQPGLFMSLEQHRPYLLATCFNRCRKVGDAESIGVSTTAGLAAWLAAASGAASGVGAHAGWFTTGGDAAGAVWAGSFWTHQPIATIKLRPIRIALRFMCVYPVWRGISSGWEFIGIAASRRKGASRARATRLRNLVKVCG